MTVPQYYVDLLAHMNVNKAGKKMNIPQLKHCGATIQEPPLMSGYSV